MGLVDRERIKLITLQKKIAPALERVEAEFRQITDGDSPLTREICDHIRQGKSKRFRPTLLLLSAQDGDGYPDDAVTAAACVELVHTATLVHDDFIDEAMTRRGLPSVNARYGQSAALIMGDYLYSKALHRLCLTGQAQAVELLARTTVLMSEAEMLQLEHRYDMAITEERYLQIIYQKTASLIENSCRIGVAFNPRLQDAGEAFGTFGAKTGLVFQITDDIFDYLGDERRLGKPTGQDWEEGRITLPLIAAWRHAPEKARARIAELAARRDGAERGACWSEVKDFVTEHGGVDYAFAKAREFGEEAKAALGPVASGPQKDLLAVAVEYVINRLN
jgi:octaprenyl-diphosphate synthase